MLRCLPPSSRSADFARKMYGQGGGPYSGEYKIKHTPIGGATGIYLSCHNTVSGDKRGSDSQYVHVRAALELRNIRSNTLSPSPCHSHLGDELHSFRNIRSTPPPGCSHLDARHTRTQCNTHDYGEVWTLESVSHLEFKIKHTPSHGGSGVYLSCHNTLPRDKRGHDSQSQYVHVQAALELCNIRSNTLTLLLTPGCVARARAVQHQRSWRRLDAGERVFHVCCRIRRLQSATGTKCIGCTLEASMGLGQANLEGRVAQEARRQGYVAVAARGAP